jgi:hypothetical protein
MKKVLLVVITSFIVNIGLAGDTLLYGSSVTESTGTKDKRDASIRILYGSAGEVDDAEIFGETIESVDSDSNGRLEIILVGRFRGNNKVGGVFGVGIFHAKHRATVNTASEVEISALGLMIQGGLAAKAGERFTIELGPYLGYGWGNHEVNLAAPDNDSDASGPYGFMGIKVGAFVLLGDRAELGVELGYERVTAEDVLGGFKNSFSGSGPRAAVALAIKF